ncbi:MAG TPA: LamG domain-containing protein [Verrucomicrobiae bacterium]
MLAVSVSAVVLVLAAAAVILALHKWHGQPDAQPQAAAQQNGSPASVKATPAAPNNSDCKALWTFDRGIGAGAIDTSGNGNDAILTGSGALWTADAKVGASALKLTGDSYAQSSGPVVNTTNSFTAAVWVKSDAFSKDAFRGYQTVLSIDGKVASGFYLQLVPGEENRFSFTRQDRDAFPSMPTRAMAASAVVVGRWYHIAGVYDASQKTMALYVDGKLQEVVPYNSAWQATGSTAIGRGKYDGNNVDFMSGTVDDVRIYDVALSPLDIQALAGKKNTPH